MIKKLIFSLFLPILTFSQNTIGLPNINNFSKSTYKAGLQNWEVKQDNNGIIYFANNEGLLSFDGKFWTLFPLPNKTIVRSLKISNDHKIYVGGQDELGFFSSNEQGKLVFHSIINLIPQKDRSLGDVWDIEILNDAVYFRTLNKIVKYAKQSVIVYNAPKEWIYLGQSENVLYAQDRNNGLYIFEKDIWKPFLLKNKLPEKVEITSILSLTNSSKIITTLKDGIFSLNATNLVKLNTAETKKIEKYRIYDATLIDKKLIVIATSYEGVFILNEEGNLVQHFAKTEGIQNNNVLSIYLDHQKNLWLGLDNGIDCIEYNSAIKHINPSLQDASGYTALIHNNNFYAGTSSGLFSVPIDKQTDISFKKGNFSLVNRSKGQIWSLAEINGKLLVGQHEGAFIVDYNETKPLSTSEGYWNFIPTSSIFPTPQIIAGNYFGLKIFNYSNNQFTPISSIPNFNESSRFVAIDKFGNIWVSHPYHGVFQITKNNQSNYYIKQFSKKNGLPSINNNHIYKIQNEILVTTEKGIYVFNYKKNTFESSVFYNTILGTQSIRYLKEDTEGNIWFIHEKNVGVITEINTKPTIIYLPELNNRILSGFEFIYPINKNNIIVGGENGFFNVDFEKYNSNKPNIKVQLRKVYIKDKNDSLLYGGYEIDSSQKKYSLPTLSKNWNNILFEFSSSLFGQQVNLEYSYRLKGYINNWSDWSNKTEKEFDNLQSGTYSFEIKVRNNVGIESEIASYTFKILPPWYKSTIAYIFYFLLFNVAIYFFIEKQRNIFEMQELKYEKEQQALEDKHHLEITEAENELVSLRNEKLQAEIDFKNSELANNAMHLLKKGELLTKMKNELSNTIKSVGNERAVTELKKMIKVLNEDEKMDEDWEHFAQHFDKVHSDFLISLKEKYPNITPSELKLSAYLRMNLSTKEIAQLMNISVRGVEISRYRLRKKLGINTEVNLFDFLINFNK